MPTPSEIARDINRRNQGLLRLNVEGQADPYADAPENVRTMMKYYPEYQSALGPEGKLQDIYSVGAPRDVTFSGTPNPYDLTDTSQQNLFANTQALDFMKNRAMSAEDSPWLKLQLQKQGLEQTTAMDNAARQSVTGTEQAQSNLAMRGGLSSGARERLARGGQEDLLSSRQNIGAAGDLNRLGLRTADEQIKMNLLSQIPGMDIGFANQKANLYAQNTANQMAQQQFNASGNLSADTGNANRGFQAGRYNQLAALGNLGDLNAYNMNKGNMVMAGVAADKLSQALGEGGKDNSNPYNMGVPDDYAPYLHPSADRLKKLEAGGWKNPGNWVSAPDVPATQNKYVAPFMPNPKSGLPKISTPKW